MRSAWVFVLCMFGCGCTRNAGPSRVVRPARSLQSVVTGIASLGQPEPGTRPFLDRPASLSDAGAPAELQTARRVVEKQLAPAGAPGDEASDDDESRCALPASCNRRNFNRHAQASRALGAIGSLLAMYTCRPPEAVCASEPARCNEVINACLADVIPDSSYECGIGFRSPRHVLVNENWLEAQIVRENMSDADAQWFVLGLFAHEQGHMLYTSRGGEGAALADEIAQRVHAPDGLAAKHKEELFADATAGCVMARAPGATVSSVMKFIAAVQRMASATARCEHPDPNDTHPCACLRNEALRLGWERCAERPLPDYLGAALPGCAPTP